MWPGHIQRFDDDTDDDDDDTDDDEGDDDPNIQRFKAFYLFLKIRSSDSLQTFVNPIYTIELNWTLLKLRLNIHGQKYKYHKASARFPVLLSNNRCQGCNCLWCANWFNVKFYLVVHFHH